MTIKEKYTIHRKDMQSGDIILFIVDSNAKGVQADRLSFRVSKYGDSADFFIVRSLSNREDVNREMRILLGTSDTKWIKYDFINGVKEMFNRKFNAKFKIKPTDLKDICSDYIKRYFENLKMSSKEFLSLAQPFPYDYYLHRDKINSRVLFLSN